ncbi:MAG: ATP-binding protein [Thermoplasmata archaeon]
MIRVNDDIPEDKLGEEILHKIITNKLKSKKNVFISIVGATGSGKSYTALKIASMIQKTPKLNVAEQVVYDPTKFLEAVKNAKEKGYKVLILDEAHVVAPAQMWHSFSNLAISLVSSIFRQIHQMALIMVAPSLRWVEKRLRELTDYYVVITRGDGSLRASMNIYQVVMNYFFFGDQEPRIIKIRFAYKGRLYALRTIKLGLPDEDVIRDYEEISTKFKSEFISKKLVELTEKMSKKMSILDASEVKR